MAHQWRQGNRGSDRSPTARFASHCWTAMIAALLLIALAPLIGASILNPNDHEPTAGSSGSIRRPRVELSGWCLECHQIDAIYNHPVEIIPSMPIPASLPLFEERMTCTTCHVYDVLGPEHGVDPGGRHWLRGRGEASSLCLQCHDVTSTRIDQVHAVNLGKAHLHWSGNSSWLASSRDRGDRFDSETQNCLSCHDGTIAADAAQKNMNSRTSKWAFSSEASHPVGVAYERSRHGKAMPLKPRHSLDKRLRLQGWSSDVRHLPQSLLAGREPVGDEQRLQRIVPELPQVLTDAIRCREPFSYTG